MELWIRSQDKRTLVNTRRIDVDDNKIIIWDEGKYASDVFMGEYATQERALEVLNEIQKLLQPQMVLSKLGKPIAETCDGLVYTEPNEYEIKELSTYVYEMPKE